MEVLTWPQKEEAYDQGKVGDDLLVICASLCGGVQGVENGDRQWEDSYGRMIFSIVGHKLSAHTEVDGYHYIESGVW